MQAATGRKRRYHTIQTSSPHKKSMAKTAEVGAEAEAEAKAVPARNLRLKRSGLRRIRKPVPSLAGCEGGPDSLSQVHGYATLLQQLHVRHGNQHHGQLWFKQLGLLRRAVRELLDVEVQLLKLKRGGQAEGIGGMKAEDVRRKFEREAELNRKKEGLKDWIRESLVPECYVRFSALVADGDGSFANLGVVLVGIVAGVGGAIGLPSTVDNEQAKRGDLRVGVRVSSRASEQRETDVEEGKHLMELDGEDFGTVVHRERAPDHSKAPEPLSNSQRGIRHLPKDHDAELENDIKTKMQRLKSIPKISPPTQSAQLSTTTTNKMKKAKKKGKQNAIDDLFSGFT